MSKTPIADELDRFIVGTLEPSCPGLTPQQEALARMIFWCGVVVMRTALLDAVENRGLSAVNVINAEIDEYCESGVNQHVAAGMGCVGLSRVKGKH